MSYEDCDPYDIYNSYKVDKDGPGFELMGADTLIGHDVANYLDEDLGDIQEIMLDMRNGRVAYAVLD